ncbi:MAG: sugar-binding domain-containing protein [Alistipes communis]
MKHIRIILCLTLLPGRRFGRGTDQIHGQRRLAFHERLALQRLPARGRRLGMGGGEHSAQWNAEDAVDDVPGFYRGPAWYRKLIVLPADAASKQVYLCFEGANQVVRLYVNGHYAGKHTGGYTRFVFDITKYIGPGRRKPLRRRGGQRPRSRYTRPCPPTSSFFGGIYRDVSPL